MQIFLLFWEAFTMSTQSTCLIDGKSEFQAINMLWKWLAKLVANWLLELKLICCERCNFDVSSCCTLNSGSEATQAVGWLNPIQSFVTISTWRFKLPDKIAMQFSFLINVYSFKCLHLFRSSFVCGRWIFSTVCYFHTLMVWNSVSMRQNKNGFVFLFGNTIYFECAQKGPIK